MEYRIYIDNVLINDLPKGFESVVLSVERDSQLDGVFYKYGSPLTFVGDGYTALKAKYDASFCNTATLKIQSRCNVIGTFVTLFEGVIQISKCIFNLSDCYVEVTLSDDVITAKIANNWRVSGVINTDRSIGRTSITPATDVNIDLFTPSTGTYDKTGRMAYTVYEAFEWLVAYMTDGSVQFASATFGGGGDYEYWYVSTGLALRDTANETAPDISFYDLYVGINKLIPLGFWVEDNAGTPRLRVEERSYFYSSTNMLNMRNIGGDGLMAKVSEELLYAKVEMGTKTYTNRNDSGGPFNFLDETFFGWKPQEYGFAIACNIDNSLDLRTELICDNNTIEDILINSNDEYDDEVVLIIGEEYSLGAFRAIKYSAGTGGDFYYNEPTMQFNVAQRWQAYIPGSFSKWLELSSVDDTCEVNTGSVSGAYTVTTSKAALVANRYPFDNEVFDNGGNFDATTNYRYTCPTDGQYGVRVVVNYVIGAIAPAVSTTVFVTINHYDSTATLVASLAKQLTTFETDFGQVQTIEISGSFLADGDAIPANADYFDVLIEAQTNTSTSEVSIEGDSTFYVDTAPGTVVQFEPTADPIVREYEFQYPVSVSEFNTIKGTPNQTITISADAGTDDDIVCWIRKIDYQPAQGVATLTLMSR